MGIVLNPFFSKEFILQTNYSFSLVLAAINNEKLTEINCKLSIDKRKNGKIFEVLTVDPAGDFIVIKQSNSDLLFGKIAVGKKIPKVSITTHKGEKKNLKKLNRHQVFMYFTSLTSKNFEKDTAILRKIAAIDSCNIWVIMFLYTNKTYTVRIFGSQSKANYTIALGHKLINKKLGIRGLPQSLLIGKRRKVIKYGLSPEEYLNQIDKLN